MTSTPPSQSHAQSENAEAGENPKPIAEEPADEFLWLEDIHGEKPLDWVREQNEVTLASLNQDEYEALRGDILEVLDSDDKIPGVVKRGEHYYNFWRDADHPRGLWRRTTWDSYCSENTEWEVLLDVDELAEREDVSWVYAGADVLRPEPGQPWRHALLSLSPDGGDARRVREFDLETKDFVDGGFDLPSAKTRTSWIDADSIFVGTDVGEGSMTTSSYPRTGRLLRRGQDPADAPVLWEVPEDHLSAYLGRDLTPGYERTIAGDIIDFYRSRIYVLANDDLGSLETESLEWQHIDVPDDVNVDIHKDWLLLRPQTDVEIGGSAYPAGSLLIADLPTFMAGDHTVRALFTPDEQTSLQDWSWTADYLLLDLLRDVSSKILVLDPANDFASHELDDAPALHAVGIAPVDDLDPECGNDYWLSVSGFLTPATLQRGTLGPKGAAAETIKTAPSFFDADAFEVEQHFVNSADGTRVPYFQIAAKDLELDGKNPTLLSGYGGFQTSRTPVYSGAVGRSWLSRTNSTGRHGVHVVANIRGGGEYGPSWHRAALQANRPRAYEDFAAIAQDLIDRGVTSREYLGCSGGSNGGLLVGNMLTTYPELFGAISCAVPLLDMRRYTKLSAGYSWIAEYGDPDDPEQWEFIRTFSPYHNLRNDVDYPATLIWTATSDDRVGPVQARKMVARMQEMGVTNVWFYEAIEGGHSAASDNRQAAQMSALSSQFLWQTLAH